MRVGTLQLSIYQNTVDDLNSPVGQSIDENAMYADVSGPTACSIMRVLRTRRVRL